MMTITFQTIGNARYGRFLSPLSQGILYVPFILIMPGMMGIRGIYFSQPAADILTLLVCLFSVKAMKTIASSAMKQYEK